MADSEIVRERAFTDSLLKIRVASLLAKYADYITNDGGATQEAKTWANYVLSDLSIPEVKANHMMWRVCWHASVKDTATAAISDATLSGIVEPVALLY
jgi:hypothetical protein